MRRMLATIVLGFTVGALAGCIEPEAKPASVQKNPECPHDWGDFSQWATKKPGTPVTPGPTGGTTGGHVMTGGSGGASSSGASSATGGTVTASVAPGSSSLVLPNRITNVPEFHDCQRMVVDSAGRLVYGVLAAVFALDSLEYYPDSLFKVPRVVAEVFLPEPRSYTPLKMTATFHCVAVQRADDGTWRGWMVPVNFEVMCKLLPSSMLTAATQLAVRAQGPPAGLDPSNIPPVARWDWDDSTKTQYLGVRCGSSWCEVGREQGFGSSASYVAAGATGPSRARVEIKGWYDEQRLAEYPPTGGLAHGANWGTVMPTERLLQTESATVEAFDGEWIPSAEPFMRPTAGPYAESLGFSGDAATPPTAKHATISLCRGNWRTCRPSWYQFFKRKACVPEGGGKAWYGKVTNAEGKNRYFCVVYREHKGVKIPTVTRWRWRRDDETVWIRCPEGCCEVNADE